MGGPPGPKGLSSESDGSGCGGGPSSAGVLERSRLGGVLGSPSIGWYCKGSGGSVGLNVAG
jgi:hypothetical protein